MYSNAQAAGTNVVGIFNVVRVAGIFGHVLDAESAADRCSSKFRSIHKKTPLLELRS